MGCLCSINAYLNIPQVHFRETLRNFMGDLGTVGKNRQAAFGF